jgi:hypothetical protein
MANVLRPLILVRGFGGADVSDDQTSPYQGFNDGTVYPTRRGENYIYEGYLLRALKSATYPCRMPRMSWGSTLIASARLRP